MGSIINKKNTELKKHVATIHCSSSLTLLQRKISNALLYHAYPHLLMREEHEITIKQLCNTIGYHGNNHAVIKEALKDLISCVIEWNVTDEKTGQEDWTASAVIACANIKGSKCTFSYSPKMRQLLYSPTMYGKINLIVQSQFRSSYGLALYENCIRYKGLPYTKWLDLKTFRKLMGVPDDKYLIFRDFKKRVIDKSVEEVNTYSDLIVEAEINKQGHKALELRFKLKAREKKKWLGIKFNEQEKIELSPPDTALVKKLKTDYGLSNGQVFKLLEEYTEEYITEKINLIENSTSFQTGKIDKLAAYLMKGLKEDYQPTLSSKQIQERVQNDNVLNEKKLWDEAEKEKSLKKGYANYVANYVEQTITQFTPKQREELEKDFENSLLQANNRIVLQRYKNKGLESGMVKSAFQMFIRNKYAILFADLNSFEEFINQGAHEKSRVEQP